MHTQSTASKLQRALSAPRSGTRPFPILNGCRQLLAIALQRAKGRDGGEKSICRTTTKACLEIESEHAEELSNIFMRATRSLFPRQGSQNNGASSHVAMPLA